MAADPENHSLEALKKRLGKLDADQLVMIIYALLTSFNSNIDEFFSAVRGEIARRDNSEASDG